MRATYTAESIFGTRGRTLILRVLHGVEVPLSAAAAARHAGLTRAAAAAALDDLESIGLVRSSPVGRSKGFWLVRDNVYVERMVAPVFVAEESMGDELERYLRDAFASLCVSVVVFGSYARDKQSADSDMDVVLVAADPTAKSVLEKATYLESERFYRTWGAPLSPLVYDLPYAANLRVTSPALYADIERDGVVVSGLRPWEWSRHAAE